MSVGAYVEGGGAVLCRPVGDVGRVCHGRPVGLDVESMRMSNMGYEEKPTATVVAGCFLSAGTAPSRRHCCPIILQQCTSLHLFFEARSKLTLAELPAPAIVAGCYGPRADSSGCRSWRPCRRRRARRWCGIGLNDGVQPQKEYLNEGEDIRRMVALKINFFAGTATLIGYQIFAYMGDNLMQQSVTPLQVKDPLFKRIGACRLARFSIDDEKRMKIVEICGAQHLLNMLESARDDRTRKESLKALFALATFKVEFSLHVLRQAGTTNTRSKLADIFFGFNFEIQKNILNLMSRLEPF
ncbi:hypothetical protein RND71_018750 [Anisodus tanguticus]|uniref:Uncharacterized protein n=1 Tax=Anisodus tanguticus TaxID=243964 RepID=A0AAE1S386_9SOLA|nr:hypothetical protein RND71_018750 [Anisodus tanguticus]